MMMWLKNLPDWTRMLPRTGPAIAGVVVVGVVAFLLGGVLFGSGEGMQGGKPDKALEGAPTRTAPSVWTCSMHPQIRLPGPGKCPICFMELIPLETGGDDGLGPRQIRLSETARELAQIATAQVQRAFAEREIRMVGKIAYDESNISSITAWVPGRLDRLYADFTGITVKKGDHMVSMYSPELLAAQGELLQATAAVDSLAASESTVLRSTALATRTAAREKLRLYGLSEQQLDAIVASGTLSEELTINAPIGGVVIQKEVLEGMYVQTGTRIYTIADLSKLWVLFEAYESDLPWLRYGQHVEFTSPSFPAEHLEAIISFIDPVVDPATRTVHVRAILENRARRLKPDMFVRGVVRSRLNSRGEVVDRSLAGKWISPMHPEVVKEGPGTCDVCGMPLVRAETLGYASSIKPNADAPLIIPASAPLITGKRAVVYVEFPGDHGPLFEGREVVLGPRAGDFYVVHSGLQEGERVVTNGAFKIDSELQIRAKPSMMSPESGPAPGTHGHDHGATRPSERNLPAEASEDGTAASGTAAPLRELFQRYFAVQTALANDDLEETRKGYKSVAEVLEKIPLSSFPNQEHGRWTQLSERLRQAASSGAASDDIVRARDAFYDLSRAMIETQKAFEHATSRAVYLAYCPMARDNEGASWLQTTDTITNPYFGEAMLRCGEVQDTFPPEATGQE